MTINFTPKYKPKRTENLCWLKNWYTNVYSSVIHNSSKVQTAKIPTDK